MGKRLILHLSNGQFASGFSVTLRLGDCGAAPTTERHGHLPAAPELAQALHDWRTAYHQLNFAGRPIGKPRSPHASDRREHCQASATHLSQTFNQWLQSDGFRPLRETWLEKLQNTDTIQVLIQTEVPPLQHLPWHTWDLLERYPHAELCLSLPSYDRTPPRSPRTPVEILAILGDRQGIDIERDRQLLTSLPDTNLHFLIEPQRTQLNDQLWQHPWQILFFAGHSQTQGDRGLLQLNPSETLSLSELRYGLRHAIQRGLQLALFNSCDGLGLARELADLHLPQMVVMREPIPDRVAQRFLQGFLQAYQAGAPLYLAVRQAREQLQGLEGEFPGASGLPMLFQNPAVTPPTWQALTRPAFIDFLPPSSHSSPSLPAQRSPTETSQAQPTQAQPTQAQPTQAQPTQASTPEPERTASPQTPNVSPSLRRSRRSDLQLVQYSRSFRWATRATPLLLSAYLGTALTTALGTGLTLGLRSLGLLQPLELKTYDALLQLRPAEDRETRLLVVTVTEADIQDQTRTAQTRTAQTRPAQTHPAQTHPERRGSLGDAALLQALQRLEQNDARLVGLDIYRDYAVLPQYPELAQRLATDTRLVVPCRANREQTLAEQTRAEQTRAEPSAQDSGVAPPPEVSSDRHGFADIVLDADQVLRRHLLAFNPPATAACTANYALSTQLILRYLADEGIHLIPGPKTWQLGTLRFQPLTLRWDGPLGAYRGAEVWGYQILLNYRRHNQLEDFVPTVSLGDLLAGRVNPEQIRDRVVLIGTVAPSFPDRAATPYGSETPGVILQAQMVSQVLSAVLEGRSLLRPLTRWQEGVLVLLAASSGALLGRRFGLVGLVGIGGIGLAGGVGLGMGAVVLPVVPMAIALGVGIVGSALGMIPSLNVRSEPKGRSTPWKN